MDHEGPHEAPHEIPLMASTAYDPAHGGISSVDVGHDAFSMLGPNDIDNPMRWPLLKKVLVSLMAFAYAWVPSFGLTSYTAGLKPITEGFGIDMTTAIVGFSITFWGVAFNPIWVPHAVERVGRAPIYSASIVLFSICLIGAAFAKNFSTILAMRFFAGFFGGAPLVLIEGTFADLWSARTTVTYYSFLTLASYIGAACGPLIAGFVVTSKGWAWVNYLTLIFAAVVFILGTLMPETFARQILRSRMKHGCSKKPLPKAPTGITFVEMTTLTILHPLEMMVSEPLVIMIALYLGLNFAVVFQWFISVPAVLGLVYGFSLEQAGLAFISAIGGVLLAALTSTVLDQLAVRGQAMPPIERRMFPAMAGTFGIVASLFWIGFTASPDFSFYSPIFGTALYVWGNASVLISFISYIFDAYPPQGTLSALTAMACFRLICAGILPIFILQMITTLQGPWTFSIFGILSVVMSAFPFIIYFFGQRMRQKSRFSNGGMGYMQLEHAAKKAKGFGVDEGGA